MRRTKERETMRDHIRIFLAVLLAALCLTTTVCAADSGAGTMTSVTETVLTSGLTYYSRTYSGDGEARQAGYSLELSPDSSVYPIFMACDTIWGGLTMSQCIQYAEGLGWNVVAAANTSFFNNPGVPIGIVVEDGKLRAGQNGQNVFAILEDGTYYVSKEPQLQFQLCNAAWEEETVNLTRFNKLHSGEELHLYSSDYSTVSTRIEEDVWVVRLKLLEGEPSLDGTMTLEVVEILPEVQEVPIGEEYLILTASLDGANSEFYSRFALGDSVTITSVCSDETLRSAAYVSGCGDVLVENGTITDESTWSPFVAGSHPRTLMGWKADGTLVIYAADGRRAGYANGLTQRQAAEEMLRQGCVCAVNLDGGGSTTMGVRLPGSNTVTVVNSPSDGGQRQCAGFVLLVTDAKPDGRVRNLHLEQNNLIVLPGQQVPLQVFGTDAALYPAQASDTVAISAERGTVANHVYQAPLTSGKDSLSLWGGGATGKGNIRVVSTLSRVEVTNAYGRPLQGHVTLYNGEPLQLNVVAEYQGKPLYTDATVVQYTMSAPLGYVNEQGNFVPNAIPGTSGTLTLTIGDSHLEVDVTVQEQRTDAVSGRYPMAMDYLRRNGTVIP